MKTIPATSTVSDQPQATAKPAKTVKMIRPEDLQAKPCVAEVAESKVGEWKDAGWVVKTDAEIAALIEARKPAATAEEGAAQA